MSVILAISLQKIYPIFYYTFAPTSLSLWATLAVHLILFAQVLWYNQKTFFFVHLLTLTIKKRLMNGFMVFSILVDSLLIKNLEIAVDLCCLENRLQVIYQRYAPLFK